MKAEDAALMAELGFKIYRFSLAWTRIIPDGMGKVNPEGIAYYRKLCEELYKHGISACVTLSRGVMAGYGEWQRLIIARCRRADEKAAFIE